MTVHKRCTKSSFIVLIFTSVITLFICFISLLFDYNWNSRISSSLKLFFKFTFFIIKKNVFVLLYKDKLKVQHESATCLLCTNMLHFYVALFLGSLVTTFNLRYTSNLVKDFLYNQSTILDWSEDVKQNNTVKLSVFKSATCEPCLQNWILRCTVLFLDFLYI